MLVLKLEFSRSHVAKDISMKRPNGSAASDQWSLKLPPLSLWFFQLPGRLLWKPWGWRKNWTRRLVAWPWASSIRIDDVHGARLLPMTFGKKNGKRSWNSWRRRWMRWRSELPRPKSCWGPEDFSGIASWCPVFPSQAAHATEPSPRPWTPILPYGGFLKWGYPKSFKRPVECLKPVVLGVHPHFRKPVAMLRKTMMGLHCLRYLSCTLGVAANSSAFGGREPAGRGERRTNHGQLMNEMRGIWYHDVSWLFFFWSRLLTRNKAIHHDASHV